MAFNLSSDLEYMQIHMVVIFSEDDSDLKLYKFQSYVIKKTNA